MTQPPGQFVMLQTLDTLIADAVIVPSASFDEFLAGLIPF
jgi:hypothetical protein